jgi:hypothetical protein
VAAVMMEEVVVMAAVDWGLGLRCTLLCPAAAVVGQCSNFSGCVQTTVLQRAMAFFWERSS